MKETQVVTATLPFSSSRVLPGWSLGDAVPAETPGSLPGPFSFNKTKAILLYGEKEVPFVD